MTKKVRVRFAPSPTGGLHLGGVRTVLFNYLFARQHGGDFVLRIEDTDQSRYVASAEQYIIDCLNWCGLTPDEGPHIGGPFAPYRQSERKDIYRQYAEQLIKDGHAYYAFDTPQDLEAMRVQYKTDNNPQPQYNFVHRSKMRNSLTMDRDQVQQLLQDEIPHVIRIKMPHEEQVSFTDMIRGEVSFNSSTIDDKVLLKADGMPTYHLAVVVDDYLMKITHAFRGEEWLPSSPVHILLWRWLGWETEMPQWAHLPLILKPDGHGKLSKRDGDRLGFPVFAMDWKDPFSGELIGGFKEEGFLPEAFINMLALLGWNDGSGQEIFTIDELTEKFSIGRVHKGGAKFDFEKAKWFNHEWIKKLPPEHWQATVKKDFEEKGIRITNEASFKSILELVRERCSLLTDFWDQSWFFFKAPETLDITSVKPKWSEAKKLFFLEFIEIIKATATLDSASLESAFKNLAAAHNIKAGELLLPLRVMLVGAKSGPPVFDIAAAIGVGQAIERMNYALQKFE